jgi:hypothetical protein
MSLWACPSCDLENDLIWRFRRLDQQIHSGVTGDFQPPLGLQLRFQVNWTAGFPQQINVSTFATIVCPGAKQQHLALRINCPQYLRDGLMLNRCQSHLKLVMLRLDRSI